MCTPQNVASPIAAREIPTSVRLLKSETEELHGPSGLATALEPGLAPSLRLPAQLPANQKNEQGRGGACRKADTPASNSFLTRERQPELPSGHDKRTNRDREPGSEDTGGVEDRQ